MQPLKKNIPMNKYQERVLNKAKETGGRIVLPEIGDKRVQEAITELTTLGFTVLHNKDFQDNTDIYMDFLNTLPFTENWPAENLREYLKDPLHCAMAMVACDDAISTWCRQNILWSNGTATSSSMRRDTLTMASKFYHMGQ